MIYGLDLFSGIGGLALALDGWVRPLAYCEIDRYCQGVLLTRQSDGRLPAAPIWDDVRTFPSAGFIGAVDMVYGGFPCQDISAAGLGKGLDGERSGLFFEMARLVGELKPTWVFLENVPAIRSRGASRVGQELARLGYDCRWDVVSAAEVGAPHLRKRWFLLAHANGQPVRDERGRSAGPIGESAAQSGIDGTPRPLADTARSGCGQGDPDAGGPREAIAARPKERSGSSDGRGDQGLADPVRAGSPGSGPSDKQAAIDTSERSGWWTTEPDVGRVAHGIPQRVDRIRGLGNAVVPLQARVAFKRLMGL